MAKLYKDLGLLFFILVSLTFFVAEANVVEKAGDENDENEGIKATPLL